MSKWSDSLLKHYEENKELIRKSIYVAGGIACLTIVLIMFGESLFSFSSSSDLRYNNPGFITKLRSARIELFNKGNHSRDFTYIADIVNGISSVIKKPKKE